MTPKVPPVVTVRVVHRVGLAAAIGVLAVGTACSDLCRQIQFGAWRSRAALRIGTPRRALVERSSWRKASILPPATTRRKTPATERLRRLRLVAPGRGYAAGVGHDVTSGSPCAQAVVKATGL
ncbi:MAG: hypothetical protein ACXWNK_18425 [Vulcanimicrobiaceae bacterium]